MTEADQAKQWEEALIADAREHDGRPSSGPLAGHPLLLMFSRGAKSGERRRAILTYSRDGDAYIVAGTAGGAPTAPAWVGNVRADGDVTIEIGKPLVRGDGDAGRRRGRAAAPMGPARDGAAVVCRLSRAGRPVDPYDPRLSARS